MTTMMTYRPLSALLEGVMDYPSRPEHGYGTVWPSVDIVENDSHFELVADLPGVAKEDIAVEVDKGVLTVRGKRNRVESKESAWAHRERLSGEFERSFRLSENVTPEGIEASYTNGVLTVTIKKAESALARKVAIK